MSREIPHDRPLSADDRQYLLERGNYALVTRLDETHGAQSANEDYLTGDGTGPDTLPLTTSEQRANRRAALEAELRRLNEIDGTSAPADEVPADEDEEPPAYEDLTMEELKAELSSRSLKTSGSKQDLVDRLYADDNSR